MPKILIVDDEPTYCWALQRLLSLHGFEVTAASDGREAIRLADEDVPDVLLVDWMLKGGLDGVEVAEALQPKNRRLRVIVMTGHPSADEAFRKRGMLPARVIRKPFASAELLAAIHDSLADGSGSKAVETPAD